jgi:hypothetical protein
MAIIKNAQLWYTKLDPARPNGRMDPKNPSWELQIRTNDPAQKKEWEEQGLKLKLMVQKEGATNDAGEDIAGEVILDASGKKQWRANLKKKSINKEGKASGPVELVNGALQPVDPNSIGNGSIGHVRVFQYEYTKKESGDKAIASVLMGVQLKRHIVYVQKPGETFEEGDTETVSEDGDDDNTTTTVAPPPTAPKSPAVPVKTADNKPEDAF